VYWLLIVGKQEHSPQGIVPLPTVGINEIITFVCKTLLPDLQRHYVMILRQGENIGNPISEQEMVKNKTDPELTLDPQLTLKCETSFSIKIMVNRHIPQSVFYKSGFQYTRHDSRMSRATNLWVWY
jgi:hypothetical protein